MGCTGFLNSIVKVDLPALMSQIVAPESYGRSQRTYLLLSLLEKDGKYYFFSMKLAIIRAFIKVKPSPISPGKVKRFIFHLGR